TLTNLLLHIKPHETVSVRDVKAAVRLVLPEQLATKAMANVETAITKFKAATASQAAVVGEKRKKSSSKAFKAGLLFPVSRIQKILAKRVPTSRQAKAAPVALAAVL